MSLRKPHDSDRWRCLSHQSEAGKRTLRESVRRQYAAGGGLWNRQTLRTVGKETFYFEDFLAFFFYTFELSRTTFSPFGCFKFNLKEYICFSSQGQQPCGYLVWGTVTFVKVTFSLLWQQWRQHVKMSDVGQHESIKINILFVLESHCCLTALECLISSFHSAEFWGQKLQQH